MILIFFLSLFLCQGMGSPLSLLKMRNRTKTNTSKFKEKKKYINSNFGIVRNERISFEIIFIERKIFVAYFIELHEVKYIILHCIESKLMAKVGVKFVIFCYSKREWKQNENKVRVLLFCGQKKFIERSLCYFFFSPHLLLLPLSQRFRFLWFEVVFFLLKFMQELTIYV